MQGVALIEQYTKEGTILVQYHYSLKYHYSRRILVMWKAFVEDRYLVTLSKALKDLAILELDNYDSRIEHYIKFVLKMQLQRIEDTSTLLTKVEI